MNKFSLILISIIIIACSNDNNEGQTSIETDQVEETITESESETEYSNVNLIKHIIKNDVVIQEFKYNSDEKIQIRNYYRDDGSFWTKDGINYEGDTVNIRGFDSMDELLSERKFYPTENANVFRLDFFDSNLDLDSYRLYTKGQSNCGFSKIQYFNATTNEVNRVIEYTYANELCSYNETWYSGLDGSKNLELKIKVDGKNSFRKYLDYDLFLDNPFQTGNIITLEIVNAIFGLTDIYEPYASEVEYNSDDFPIYEKRIYENGSYDEFKYEYY